MFPIKKIVQERGDSEASPVLLSMYTKDFTVQENGCAWTKLIKNIKCSALQVWFDTVCIVILLCFPFGLNKNESLVCEGGMDGTQWGGVGVWMYYSLRLAFTMQIVPRLIFSICFVWVIWVMHQRGTYSITSSWGGGGLPVSVPVCLWQYCWSSCQEQDTKQLDNETIKKHDFHN